MSASSSRQRVWIGLVLGVALVCLSYALAGRSTASGDQAKFVLLWLGIVVFLWPAARRLADPLVSESERLSLLAAAGLFTYLPKFLRNPQRPVFYDEIAHWTQVERLSESGDLFQLNPAVRVLPSYPGLHTLTSGLRELTGLSTWQVGVALIAVLHVVSAIGVYVLAKRLVGSPVVAGLAGLLWCIAPGAMFFNSQFAYQSLAIVGFVWTIVAVAEAEAARGALRWRWVGIAGLLATAVVVTHHLSSYALVVLLACFTVAGAVQARRDGSDDWKPAGLLLALAVGVNGAWMWVRGGSRAIDSIVDYLSPYPENGVEQLLDVLGGTGERRTFFARSGLPGWEQLAAWLAPLAVIVLGIIGVRLLSRMSLRPRSGAWALAGFSLLYVAALPLVLTPSGAQGAHRSFPFTYLGICLVAAAGLAMVIGRAATSTGRLRRAAPLAVAVVIGIVTVGNTAANVNEFDRFPGPWEAGADSRARTDELDRAAAWLEGLDSDDRVVTDLYSGTTLGVFGTTRDACAVAAACPGDLAIWRFYDGQPIRERDLRQLEEDGYRFLAVDRRMAEATPRSGFWFNRSEEGASEHEDPYPAAALSRLEGFTWLTKVYASSNYDLYEIHVGAADADVLEGEPGAATIAAEAERKAAREEAGDAEGEAEPGDAPPAATDDQDQDPDPTQTAAAAGGGT
jgi:hypothetical protein